MDVLRAAIQPITHNLPHQARDALIALLGDACYKTLLLDVDLADGACAKLAISKGLGIGIIGASAVVKIPQLLKLVNSQSSDGISFLSYLLETSAYLINLAYNYRHGFPFSTYGETALIAAQNVVISVLVLRFAGQTAAAGVFVAGLAAALYSLFDPSILTTKALGYAQMGAGALSVGSKVPQILAIWQQGGTGQLSAFAVFNYLVGSLSRIFTTLQEVDDPLILYGFIAGFALNAVLAAQMVYYWNAPTDKSKQRRAGNQIEDVAAGLTTGSSARKGPSTRRRG
ncbi:MAG: hypothetical protein M1814_000122 [Vezdaea aestivalis]|nr:MAG: hypothetical protein M1814_000122 [Vezdaea aestivalis]